MEKTEFLKQVSMMTKEDVRNLLNKENSRIKKIYPVYFLRPTKEKRNKVMG